MITKCWLTLSKTGVVKVTKGPPTLRSTEIGLNLTLNVPDRFFTRPKAEVTIVIPDAAVMPTEASVDLVAGTIAESFSLSVDAVKDGLADFLERSFSGGDDA